MLTMWEREKDSSAAHTATFKRAKKKLTVNFFSLRAWNRISATSMTPHLNNQIYLAPSLSLSVLVICSRSPFHQSIFVFNQDKPFFAAAAGVNGWKERNFVGFWWRKVRLNFHNAIKWKLRNLKWRNCLNFLKFFLSIFLMLMVHWG